MGWGGGGLGKVVNHSAMGCAESIKWVKNLAIVHRRARDDTKGGWAKKKKQCIGIWFLAVSFFDLSKVSKMAFLILTCSKSAK